MNGWHTSILDDLAPLIDETIAKLESTKFRVDPLAGTRLSRITSIISSAYKRHGLIVEQAILKRLQENSKLEAWSDPKFKLSAESQRSVSLQGSIHRKLNQELDYGEEHRCVSISAIVFDKSMDRISAYLVKRGNGYYDSGKKKRILHDVLQINMLLKSYARRHNLNPTNSQSSIIFYYGVVSAPGEVSLVGDDLDEHFGFPVKEAVEIANDYFRKKLFELIGLEKND